MMFAPAEALKTQGTTAGSDAAGLRARALARWLETNLGCSIDRSDLETAAAVATLTVGADGPSFDPAVFGELVEFVAEMPF